MAEVNFDIFTDVFQNTSIGSFDFLLTTVLLVMIMLMISRKPSQWGTLAFPIVTCLHIIGLQVHILLFIISIAFFTLNNLSISLLTTAISSTQAPFRRIAGIRGGLENRRIKKERKTISKLRHKRQYDKTTKQLEKIAKQQTTSEQPINPRPQLLSFKNKASKLYAEQLPLRIQKTKSLKELYDNTFEEEQKKKKKLKIFNRL